MDIIRSDGGILENIDLDPQNTHAEVLQNVAIILASIQKSCPMVRGLGIDGSIYGRLLPVIQNLLVAEIYDQIETYEPRAIIGDIEFETDNKTGQIITVLSIEGVNEDG